MKVSDIILSSKMLSCLTFGLFHSKNQVSYNRLMSSRRDADLLDYETIAKPLPNCYEDICPDNNCFGIGHSIRQYCGWKKRYINAFVEHGYFFGQYVSDQETKSFAKVILTFGDIRKKHIESKINKKAIPIGPYIHYAPDYLKPEQFAVKKKELGRVLLVFFSHSGTGCSVEFDVDYIISKIEEIRKDFDTVVVSLFWSDINKDIVSLLTSKGYKIFSAGNRYDSLFLSRLKSMILLSDVTMSNSISTHMAYCSYLGKPHWYVKQEVTEKAISEKASGNIIVATQIKKDEVAIEERAELSAAFENYSDILQDWQRVICNKYFGFDAIKSPEEMAKILGDC